MFPSTLVLTTSDVHYIFLHIYVSASGRIQRTRKKSCKDIMICFSCIFPAGQSEGESEGCACPSGQIWWALWETTHKWPGHHLHFGWSALPYPQGPQIPHSAIKQEDSQPSDLPATQPVPVGWVTLGSNLPWGPVGGGLLLVSYWCPENQALNSNGRCTN